MTIVLHKILILTTRLSDTIVRKQKKQKRKVWRPLKDMEAGGCMNEEAEEEVTGDTFSGDESKTGGEARTVFV